jgi:flagellar hook protein FlgE
MSVQSLRTGVSGLDVNQTRLDVVSNNIANSGTVGFKRGRAVFSEVLGQQIPGVSDGPSGESRTGRGAAVDAINKNFEQGSLDQTGIKTDLALSGDGFFVASRSEGAANQQRQLPRAGNFTFNENGKLVTSSGLAVQGWEVDDNGKALTGELQDIQFDPNAQSAAKFTSETEVGGNLSADAEDGDTTSISSVVYDEQGTAYDAVIEFEKTATNNEWNYTVEAADSDPFTTTSESGTITFNSDGSVDEIDGSTAKDGPSMTWKSSLVSGSEDINFNLRGLTQYSGSTTAKFESQNGNSAGELSDFNFTQEGELELSYTNGKKEKIFQLAVGNVNNPDALEQQGDNLFTTTSASGDLQLGRARRDLQTSVESGSLESSNVELADSFASLIEAQRNYQASSRVVTTADQVLQETVQLKR